MKISQSNLWILMFLQLHPLVTSQAPTSGCDAISDEGTCYSYFTSSGINWQNARDMCLAWGGDLATVTSLEENTLMFNTITAGDVCWMGLNDIVNENTFVWADGSSSTYRNWHVGEPNDSGGNEDCVDTFAIQDWNDLSCTSTINCYFCSSTVIPFGEQINANTFITLKDNSLLNTNATLYCITENKNTPQVNWTFEDTNGVSTNISATTDATTGVSTLSVTNDKAGYYRCEVSQNGGNTRTYTVEMLDFNLGAPVLTLLYYGCGNAFSLLPPAINRADIPILTQNASLSTNLVGRWQTPDGSYVNSDSITIPTLYMSHAGLYKFDVANWDGDWTLAIQIYISPVGTAYTTELPTNTEAIIPYTMYTFIAVLVIFVILQTLALFMCVLIVCAMKRRRSNKLNSREHQIQFPQTQANEIPKQVDTTNPMAHGNKANKEFLSTGRVEVSKQLK